MKLLDKIFDRIGDYSKNTQQQNILVDNETNINDRSQFEVVQPTSNNQVKVKDRVRVMVGGSTQLEGYQKRAYKAAGSNRTISGWNGSYLTANEETRSALTTLRALSRDLELNNDYMLKYLAAVVTNVVGSKGFSLQLQIKDNNGSLDTLANNLVEEGFKKWCSRTICETTGRFTFKELTRLIIRTVARDGECLVRKIRDKSVNKFGYSLQLLDIDRLVTNYNKKLDNGNIVSMGIETDKYQRPINYYINTNMSVQSNVYTKDIEIVPADEILHIYRSNRAEQFRGIPWTHSVIATLEMLAGYQDAAVTKKRIVAATMGFFTNELGDAAELGDEEDEETGEYVSYAEPGKFTVLPKGSQFTSFDPQSNDDYYAFVKSVLRSVSAALGISYHTLANDLENVNFSSIRAGVLEERDLWKTCQDWFIAQFLEPVFKDWLYESLKNGALQYPGGSSLPIEKFDKFMDVAWTGRRWSWVSPTDETKAAIDGIGEVINTRTQTLADQGLDFDEVLNTLSQEEKKIREAGVTVTSFIKAAEQQTKTNTQP